MDRRSQACVLKLKVLSLTIWAWRHRKVLAMTEDGLSHGTQYSYKMPKKLFVKIIVVRCLIMHSLLKICLYNIQKMILSSNFWSREWFGKLMQSAFRTNYLKYLFLFPNELKLHPKTHQFSNKYLEAMFRGCFSSVSQVNLKKK